MSASPSIESCAPRGGASSNRRRLLPSNSTSRAPVRRRHATLISDCLLPDAHKLVGAQPPERGQGKFDRQERCRSLWRPNQCQTNRAKVDSCEPDVDGFASRARRRPLQPSKRRTSSGGRKQQSSARLICRGADMLLFSDAFVGGGGAYDASAKIG